MEKQDNLYENQNIKQINIDDEMKNSFLAYSMSVIVSRALPDVRDGLKPVHRRILYAMHNAGYTANRAYKKSARIVGDVLGRYHPHGDTAVYDSLVRMAQNFSLRYPLIDGQGNYGSIDGDSAAAMRYTEARMSRISMEMLTDIEKDTVNFAPNFDESLQEPTVLPAKLPHLLLNGTSGIAVGMATNIPPHNLGELVDGICALIDNPDIEIIDLMKYIKGPDFPTAGIICGTKGIHSAYHTGKGSVIIRAKTRIEELKKGKEAIIVEELPYQVNKANLIMKIAELVTDKKINGIADLRDESDRKGMRIYIELKRDANSDIVLNHLYKHTQLQNSFGINIVALVNGVPKTLNLKQVLSHYINHRKEIVIRRTQYDLKKARERLHILEGLRIALQNIDEVIELIKKSPNVETARNSLMAKFDLSQIQAQAILDMRLQRLTNLEQEKIENEYKELLEKVLDYEDILANEARIYSIIKEEQLAIKEKYNDKRRSIIGASVNSVELEDLIPDQQVAILLSKKGFVKRMPISVFKSQLRGGRGINSMTTRDEDMIDKLIITSTLDYILWFTSNGRVFKTKAYKVPEQSRQSKGVSISHFLHLEDNEHITAIIGVDNFESNDYLFMTTAKGIVKKTPVNAFTHLKNKSIIAINLDEGDTLNWVEKTNGHKDILLVTSAGMTIRFSEESIRPMGRSTRGVKGIKIKPNDKLVSMNSIDKEEEKLQLLIITSSGYGKNIKVSEFKNQNRGGIGVLCLKFRKSIPNDKVQDGIISKKEEEVLIVTKKGTLCRQQISKISTQKRTSQGVRILKLDDKDEVIAIEKTYTEEENKPQKEK